MIRELVADGTTVLLTTQYLEEADQLASRIAVVDGGKVIANDTPTSLKAQLGSTVVEMTFADGATAERAAAASRAPTATAIDREGSDLRVSSDRGAKVLVEVLRRLDAVGIEPATLAVREPSLDDVFLSLTGRHVELGTEGGAA